MSPRSDDPTDVDHLVEGQVAWAARSPEDQRADPDLAFWDLPEGRSYGEHPVAVFMQDRLSRAAQDGVEQYDQLYSKYVADIDKRSFELIDRATTLFIRNVKHRRRLKREYIDLLDRNTSNIVLMYSILGRAVIDGPGNIDGIHRRKLYNLLTTYEQSIELYISLLSEIAESYIDSEYHISNPSRVSARSRLARLFALSKTVSEDEFVEFAEKLLPELSSITAATNGLEVPLPTEAPALWAQDKQPGDSPPDFITRHYSPWLGNGLHKATLRSLDGRLVTALDNWLRTNPAPPDFDLPTLKEANDRWVARVKAGELPTDANDLSKVASALRYRSTHGKD